MSFLLIGGDSAIAKETREELVRSGAEVISTTRRSRDSEYFLDLDHPLGTWQPAVGVTAACIFAAATRLRDCEKNPLGTRYVNVIQTIELARRLIEKNIYVLFLSSSQVFDGTQKLVNVDSDFCPISEYGRQKADAERRLANLASKNSLISVLRLSKIFSTNIDQLRQWPKLLAQGEMVDAFNDMYIAPVPMEDASSLIIKLLIQQRSGTFQLSGTYDISYAQMARYIADRTGAPSYLLNERAALANLPSGSTPRHTTLDSSAVVDAFGISPRDPWQVVDLYL